jgi:hypothetical protein
MPTECLLEGRLDGSGAGCVLNRMQQVDWSRFSAAQQEI